jgi:hypothetical protein
MRWVVLAAICVGVVVSFIPAYSIVLRKKAESLIRNASIASQLLGKTTTLDTVQAIYNGNLTQKPDCTPVYCGYEVVESNWVLAALRWTPYSEAAAQSTVRFGVLGLFHPGELELSPAGAAALRVEGLTRPLVSDPKSGSRMES